MVRVVVLDSERCRSKDCGTVCYRFCPMVRSKVEAITFPRGAEKPVITEALCSGCGICVRKCPFKALSVVNLADELQTECSHRFGPNTFKLFRLPTPKPSSVTGLIGKNGIGKTTALKILSGEIKPNLGEFESPPDWREITQHYRGSSLQDYFEGLSTRKLRVVYKPQYVDKIPQAVSGKVGALLRKADKTGRLSRIADRLQLKNISDRSLDVLSGGELQQVAIAAVAVRDADVYLFDEPSSYLDIKQRLEVARVIRGLAEEGKTVVVAEHDLAVLDYLSDQVCILYGDPGVYGIISKAHGVRTGINIYLDGYLPEENMRFRNEPIKFHIKPAVTAWGGFAVRLSWDELKKSYPKFGMSVKPGEIHEGEVIGILGSNGTGKTTFLKLLAGVEKPDPDSAPVQEGQSISYKPQYIAADYEGSVESLLRAVAKEGFGTGWYESEIVQPLGVQRLMDQRVVELSGGELQRVAIAACLSQKASIYLLDEPSAYLDVEERLAMARVIRRIVESRGVTAFVVEHDVSAQDFIADRIVVFKGEPGLHGLAESPANLRDGMNSFLKDMNVTFRRDPSSGRPRVNKEGSKMDRRQKELGEYYYAAPAEEEE